MKNTVRFDGGNSIFADASIASLVRRKREYDASPDVRFHHADYNDEIDESMGSFDLLISQWAGFVSQAGKRYLRHGGILLANNSHGDASMAKADPDYEFVGVATKANRVSCERLDRFFVPKKEVDVTMSGVRALGRGIGYTHSPPHYLFRIR